MSSVNLLGSQIDVASIVENLMYLERAPVRTMETKVTSLQNKVSAYQNLNSKMSALSGKVNMLLFGETTAPFLTPYSFNDRLSKSAFSKGTASSSDEDAISVSASNATVNGSYSLTVGSLAQAKTMASMGFADTESSLAGTGSITITTGDDDPVEIEITSGNNSLEGIRNAINNADAGVTATIINDGSATPYRMLITAKESGTENSFSITENLSGGQALSMTQTQAAKDAQLVINGVSITKSSNTISDVISGVTFTLKEVAPNPVTVKIDKDTDAIITAVKEMISAYNAVSSFINGQFAYNAASEKAGVLAGDPTLRNIQSKLQTQITQSISNKYTTYGVAGQVGLDFNRDGSLSLDETEFREALSENFTAVAALFLGDGVPPGGVNVSDSRVTYSGKTEATQPGAFDVTISALAERAVATGIQAVTTLANDETLSITYGGSTALVQLYAGDSLETILSSINSSLTAEGISAVATDDGSGKVRIATHNYGSAESISVVSDRDAEADTTGFGTSPVVGTGKDIAGSIGGNAAIGSGLTLTGTGGQPEDGLSLLIAQSTTGSYGTVTVAEETEGSKGSSILMNMFTMLKGLTDSLNGPLKTAMDGLNNNIQSINKSIESYEDRLLKRRDMLTLEFSKADEALKMMSLMQASLSSQLSQLN